MLSVQRMQPEVAQKFQKGFTLVELSIVLVIIGLIVASVLVGQDLVRQAEIRGAVTQYEQYNTAVKTFETKFGGLPGDVTGAATYGWTGDGNADGVLVLGPGGLAADENVFFWSHLGADSAALISGSYAGVLVEGASNANNIAAVLPATKVGNYWGVFADASDINYYILGASNPDAVADGEFETTATLSPVDALAFDRKVDDARPGRGVVQARGAAANAPDTAATILDSATPAAGAGQCTYEAGANSVPLASCNTVVTAAACTLRVRF